VFGSQFSCSAPNGFVSLNQSVQDHVDIPGVGPNLLHFWLFVVFRENLFFRRSFSYVCWKEGIPKPHFDFDVVINS
jgi:hypothetical protein